MKVLLHICCGPCLVYPLRALREEGVSVSGFFYNPNIHPYTEFKKRMETMDAYAKTQRLKVACEVGYDLEEYLRGAAEAGERRCAACYEMRLRKTAQAAKDAGFDAFCTTLLYSRYQKHALIVQVANVLAAEIGVEFLYRDFREGWSEGQDESRRLGMYRQKYCGCVYSEKERYERDLVRLAKAHGDGE